MDNLLKDLMIYPDSQMPLDRILHPDAHRLILGIVEVLLHPQHGNLEGSKNTNKQQQQQNTEKHIDLSLSLGFSFNRKRA